MNLLPSTEKGILKKGLELRFVITALFLLSLVFLLGVGMLLPSYFLTWAHLSSDQLENYIPKTEDEDSTKEILNLPNEMDFKLKFMQSNMTNLSVTDTFYKITKDVPGGVTLDAVSFSRNKNYKEKIGTNISVSGIAFDRGSLMSFSTILKESGSFSAVDIPVSILTKDRNLPFTTNIFIEN